MIELVNDVGVKLINASASDEMVAMAAWVSHDADSEDRLQDTLRLEKLIGFLYRQKHMSPFEHGHFTFKIDAPLFVAREFMRHRSASYNEVSGRYSEMKPRFYAGDTARVQRGKPGDYYFEDGTDEQTAFYLQSKRRSVEADWVEYTERLATGLAKEQAREDLPLSLMTQFYVTMNPRNLMQFLTLRNEKHALKEIRDVAVKMEDIFARTMPITYGAYKSVRDVEHLDVEKMAEELRLVKSQVVNLEATSKNRKETVAVLQAQLAKVRAERDEAVKLYNGAFVATKEKTNASANEENDDVWRSVTDKIANEKIAELKKNPVYNIVINAAKDVDVNEIARRVFESLEKRKK